MRIIAQSIFICVIMISCQDKTLKEYYVNGNLKTVKKFSKQDELVEEERYDSIGNLKRKYFLKEGTVDSLLGYTNGIKSYKKEIIDSKVFQTSYNSNGAVESKGALMKDSLKVGWWNYYNESGNLLSKREYVLVCDDYYLNQSIMFDEKGDTVYKKSDFNETIFFNYKLKKGYSELEYNISPISYRSNLELILLKSDDRCNEDLDTIIQLEKRKGTLKFNNVRRDFRGFIFDYYIDTTYVDGVAKPNMVNRKMYFDSNPDKKSIPAKINM